MCLLLIVPLLKNTYSQAKKQLEEIKQKEANLQLEYERLYDSVANKPSIDAIKAMSKKVSSQFESYQLRINTIRRAASRKPYDEMTYQERRALVEMVFSGKTPDGKRMGVYIEWNSRKQWKFDIHGHLIDEQVLIPLSESRKKTFFNFDEGGFGGKQKELVTKSASH